MQRKLLFPVTAALLLGVAACSQQTTKQEAPKEESPFRAIATIQDIMDSEIDPSADFIWASVGFVATQKGIDDKTPKTDKEWAAVRHSALILVEAANLLVMDGRRVSDEMKPLDEEEKGGIEDPKEIQKAIEMNRAAFVGFAKGLQNTSLEMLQAIDKKDIASMDAAGEKLDAACEVCHRTFWYPNAVEPIQTLEPPAETPKPAKP